MKIHVCLISLALSLSGCLVRPEKPDLGKSGDPSSENGEANPDKPDNTNPTTPDTLPDPGKGPLTAAQIAALRTDDFTAFIKTADALDLTNMDERIKVPGILLNNQFALSDKLGERPAGTNAQGRCLLFNATATPIKATDITGTGLVVSPLGKIVYSESKTMVPSACQDIFKTQLTTLYPKNFYDLHASYYSFN